MTREYKKEDDESKEYKSGEYRSKKYNSGDYKSGEYRSKEYNSGDYKSREYKNKEYEGEEKKDIDVKSLSLQELTEEITAIGEKPFRARQMYEWMHKKLARGFGEMTNLSKQFRELCEERYDFTALKAVCVQESQIDGMKSQDNGPKSQNDGPKSQDNGPKSQDNGPKSQDNGTKKFLFELSDGNVVESVWMKYHHGNSVCISSQAGCRMGCHFCASALGGLERNLLPSEMLDQIYAITLLTGERVSNVVVMGTGEPLDNYDNLLRFLRMLTDENGLHISQRNVTVSTCGLVPEIKRLAGEKLQITLALSLHAASDEKRRKLMPIAEKYSIRELMKACGYYFEQTGRRITFEYSLMRGVNDTDEDARRLAELARPLGCHVNLIPINPVRERNFSRPDRKRILAFQNILEKNKINVTIRREMGRDIDGACGQLRRRTLEEMKRVKDVFHN